MLQKLYIKKYKNLIIKIKFYNLYKLGFIADI